MQDAYWESVIVVVFCKKLSQLYEKYYFSFIGEMNEPESSLDCAMRFQSKDPYFTPAHHRLDFGGSWVKIPSGTCFISPN